MSAGYDGEDDEPEFSNAWNGIYNQIMGKQSADGIDTVSRCYIFFKWTDSGISECYQPGKTVNVR